MCALVHEHGGQVYIDGANLNALLGLAKPGQFGGDVSHLNLHKTFCIPHGGGGPGVGPGGGGRAPGAVPARRTPCTPTRRSARASARSARRRTAAPASSPSAGPTSACSRARAWPTRPSPPCWPPTTSRLGSPRRSRSSTPARNGLVAHECILDLRPLTKATGVTVDDVAKRLIDYGFHAPTVSFPVAGTLMVEPTESEDLGELDRFCDAMIAIRDEIDEVAAGRWARRGQPAARRAAHRGCAGRGVGPALRPRDGGVPGRCRPRRSTGHRWRGSTRPTGTATSCAPARRPRRSTPETRRSEQPGEPDPGGGGGQAHDETAQGVDDRLGAGGPCGPGGSSPSWRWTTWCSRRRARRRRWPRTCGPRPW